MGKRNEVGLASPGGDDGVDEWTPGRKRRASLNSHILASLQLESQAKSSWIVTVMRLKRKVEFEPFRDLVTERLIQFPRLRSVIVDRGFGKACDFQELGKDELDLNYLWKKALDGKVASDVDLNGLIGGLFEGWEPRLDQPLWQITFIPELESGSSCLLINLSHALGDGVGLIELLYRILDANPSDIPRTRTLAKAKPPGLGFLAKANVFISGLMQGTFVTLTPPDKKTTLRLKNIKKPSPTKACAFSPTVDVAEIKAVQALYQYATFNDVLMTLLNLTMEAYFEQVNDKTAMKSKLRAQFPVNLRKKNQGNFRDGSPRNLWMYGFMPLHVSKKGSPTDLFWKTKRSLDKVKNSPAPIVTLATGKLALRTLPRKLANKLLINAAGKSTLQLSNVAGPSNAVFIGGEEVEALSFQLFAPLSIYVGLLTYNGKLAASFNLDSSLADPELLAKNFVPSFEAFKAHAIAEATKHGGLIKQPSRGWF